MRFAVARQRRIGPHRYQLQQAATGTLRQPAVVVGGGLMGGHVDRSVAVAVGQHHLAPGIAAGQADPAAAEGDDEIRSPVVIEVQRFHAMEAQPRAAQRHRRGQGATVRIEQAQRRRVGEIEFQAHPGMAIGRDAVPAHRTAIGRFQRLDGACRARRRAGPGRVLRMPGAGERCGRQQAQRHGDARRAWMPARRHARARCGGRVRPRRA